MRWLTLVLSISASVAGCTLSDENPAWNPRAEYPPWTYDAPFYYRPTEDLKVAETIGEDIGVYFTGEDCFFIRHPAGCQASGVPRVAVWCSRDQGKQWDRYGYFGVEQSHFLFKADADGRYWIRFVGPGQGVCEVPPGRPHRIYVVDTKPPHVTVTVTPSPAEKQADEHDERNTFPGGYRVGERVVLKWAVSDENLAAGTVKLGTCFAKFPHNLVWNRFPQSLPASGKMNVDIPPEAVMDGGLRFRVEATDKAGNTAAAFTPVLHVYAIGPAAPVEPPKPSPPPGRMPARGGWPMPGCFIRGQTSRVLNWLPPAAARYGNLKLQFSPDDGRTWRTVAAGFKFGQAVKWTAPNVNSRNCRLRVVAVVAAEEPDGQPRRLMLAATRRFTIDTVAPDAVIPDADAPTPLSPNDE